MGLGRYGGGPAAVTVTLGGVGDPAALAEAAGPDGIHVIVDYLWGAPTEAAITAITRRGLAHAAPQVRLVEVGQMAGPTIALPAEVLRSSGLEVLGSGPISEGKKQNGHVRGKRRPGSH